MLLNKTNFTNVFLYSRNLFLFVPFVIKKIVTLIMNHAHTNFTNTQFVIKKSKALQGTFARVQPRFLLMWFCSALNNIRYSSPYPRSSVKIKTTFGFFCSFDENSFDIANAIPPATRHFKNSRRLIISLNQRPIHYDA
jgi:hypothetical protein